MPLGRNSTKPRELDIQRDDAITDTTPVGGNLVKPLKPKFVSLVGLPANQTGFKVVRSDTTGGAPMKSQPTLIRRTRRNESSPVLRLTFPEGNDEATVAEALKNYGLTGYKVEQTDGVYTATRADLNLSSNVATTDIKLTEDGLIATVAAPASTPTEKSAVRMASLEFDADKFTLEDVQKWAVENSVDGEVQEPQNADQCYVIKRGEVVENEETRKMVLEDGVTAVIARADVGDVPAGFVAVINETAYGNWGWGQLDFTAALADKQFSEAMRSSINTLEDILRNIVIWSPLPLDVRKDLANRALTQFGEYMSNVMDSLPRQLLVAVVRSATQTLERNEMTQKTTGGANPTPAAAGTGTDPAQSAASTAITREDVTKLVTEGITAAVPTIVAAVRDAMKEPAKEPAAPATGAEPAANAVTREDLQKTLDAVADIGKAVKELQGTTVTRSAESDEGAGKGKGKGEPVKEDVFRGAIPGLRTRRVEQAH